MEDYLFCSAIRLNNAAGRHFSSGNIDQAVQLFRQALALSRELIRCQENSENGNMNLFQTNKMAAVTSHAMEQAATPLSPTPRRDWVLQQGVSLGVGSAGFLYLSPMTLEDEDTLSRPMSSITLGLVCTFNLAITLHTKGLLLKSRCNKILSDRSEMSFVGETVLSQAARLYELSYSLVTKCGEEQRRGPFWIIAFSVLNNLGVLLKQLGAMEKASKAFDALLSMLMFNRQQRPSADDLESNSYQHAMDGFYANAITELGVLSKVITAPSA